ncbi:MAG: endonuclease/exonuclease/phosphatase family protein [Rubripirellula sp.]
MASVKSLLFRICLCGLALLVCELPSQADETANTIDVVTYNIRYANPRDGEDVWSHRVEAVADFLAGYDIAGLQEVTAPQLDELVTRLPEHGWYGLGRDDGKRGGEHAPILYRRDRFEPIDQGTFWLSESPAKIGVRGWDAALPRTCTWMTLLDKQSGNRLWIANTHFDHRGSQARTESGKLIQRVARERGGDLPVIVMGDFNCSQESDPYRALTSGGYLVDARSASQAAVTGPDSTWNGFKEIAPGRIIDHLFVHGPVTVQQFNTLDPKTKNGRFASDHLPVQIRIHLSQPGSTTE